ncbi:MAG: LemA family protein, partial [Planctomycetota bacterium]
RLAAEHEIGQALSRLFATASSADSPDAPRLADLERRHEALAEQIGEARARYNELVFAINDRLESFPLSAVAGLFGFRRHEFFEAGL